MPAESALMLDKQNLSQVPLYKQKTSRLVEEVKPKHKPSKSVSDGYSLVQYLPTMERTTCVKEKKQEKIEDRWEIDKPEIFQKMYADQQSELKRASKCFGDIQDVQPEVKVKRALKEKVKKPYEERYQLIKNDDNLRVKYGLPKFEDELIINNHQSDMIKSGNSSALKIMSQKSMISEE